MKKNFTLFKTLLVAVGLCVGSSAWAQDVWTFSSTTVWGNMTSGGKSSNYKEISTGSEVWFAPDGTTATSTTSNVSFIFSAGEGNEEGARFNFGGTNYLGIQKNYDSTNDINYVKVVVPNNYRVIIEVHTGSTGRPMTVNLGGTATSYTTDATYDYTNTTGNAQTIKIYATAAKEGDWKTNSVKSITLIDTQTTASHSWTANAVATIGNTATTIKTYSSEADVMEGVDYTITVDKAIIYNEKCYVLNDAAFSANIYSKTYTMGTSAGSHTFTYEEVENFAFYGEAENIVSGNKNGAVENGAFFSNGKGYRAQATSGYVTLAFHVAEAGLYHIMLGMNNNNSSARGYNYAIDGGTVSDTKTVNANTPSVLEIDQVLASGDHTITLNITYSRTPCFDYLLIQKTGDATVSKTITAAGWATYCSPYALDFSNVEGLTAYIVKGADANGVLDKEEVTTIPANTGVLLKGTAGNYNIPVVASAEAVSGNKMVGVTANTSLVAKGGWVLMSSPKLGFYCNSNVFTVGANTAYIPVDEDNFAAPAETPSGAKARFFSLDGDDATAINGIESEKNADNAAIYNLAGQRVNAGYKGIVIKNGKKFMNK